MKEALPYRCFGWENATKSIEEWNAIIKNPAIFEEEWLHRKNNEFKEMHHATVFPENWGKKTNGTFSRVAGKSFAQAASDQGYCNW
eukprot:5963634-Prymnesium_polylepis.1